MHTLDGLDAESLRDDVPDFRPGDTLKVHVRVVEGTRERVQIFQGIVIRRQGAGNQTHPKQKVPEGLAEEVTHPLVLPETPRSVEFYALRLPGN